MTQLGSACGVFGEQVSVKMWKDGVGDVENKDQETDGRNRQKVKRV